MLSTTKLSQYAVSQSEAREVRHTIPACNSLDKLSQHTVANSEAGKLDMLSQHATVTNHRSGKLDMLSQHTQHKHTIPACSAKSKLYERGFKSPEQ